MVQDAGDQWVAKEIPEVSEIKNAGMIYLLCGVPPRTVLLSTAPFFLFEWSLTCACTYFHLDTLFESSDLIKQISNLEIQT